MTPFPLPYKILALGPFAPVPEDSFKPEFIRVDLYSIDEAIERLSPVLYLPLPPDQCPEGAVTLKFKSMKDFKPEAIAQQAPMQEKHPEKSKATAIDDILSMVATPDSSTQRGQGGQQPDSRTSSILQTIFSTPEFQKIEGAWRGLQALVKKAGIKGFGKIQVTISSVSHPSLDVVLNAIETLPYAEIPNLVLIDLGFDNTLPSIENLEKIIGFADRMILPVCVWMKSEFFRIQGWGRLYKIQYIKNHLDDISYAKFRKLKLLAGAERVMVSANGFFIRPAHGCENAQPSVSSVWAMGTLCAKAVSATGWPMEFTRYDTHKIDDLALSVCDGNNTAATQALFSEDRIMQLIESGITPLVGIKNQDMAIIPKEASLTGDSMKFQMLINRIVELMLHLKQEIISHQPQDEIRSALIQIFTQTRHPAPSNLEITESGNASENGKIFHISFLLPKTMTVGSERIEYSFAW